MVRSEDESLSQDFHENLLLHADALITDETDYISMTANLSSLIFHEFNRERLRVNWAGFYYTYVNSDKSFFLQLGPFQGKPACIRIPFGKGVCGTAAETRTTLVVPDVHEFPGHIACDSSSESEIVVPIISNDRVVGVLDIDSPTKDQFQEADKKVLEAIVHLLATRAKWPSQDI